MKPDLSAYTKLKLSRRLPDMFTSCTDAAGILREAVSVRAIGYCRAPLLRTPTPQLPSLYDLDAFVYVLRDPKTLKIHYIGCTSSPLDRYRGHCSRNSEKTRLWVQHLRTLGLRPVLDLRFRGSRSDALIRESRIIRYFKQRFSFVQGGF